MNLKPLLLAAASILITNAWAQPVAAGNTVLYRAGLTHVSNTATMKDGVIVPEQKGFFDGVQVVRDSEGECMLEVYSHTGTGSKDHPFKANVGRYFVFCDSFDKMAQIFGNPQGPVLFKP